MKPGSAGYSDHDFQRDMDVDDNVMARLSTFDRELCQVSEAHNLIARSTLPDRWHRHFLDSAQLFPLIPTDATSILDIGSGAGFPGLVLAAMMADRDCQVTMVESVGKKAAFLENTANAMGLGNVIVINDRVESLSFTRQPDVILARALAGLDKLLGYAHPHCGPKTMLVLPKGAKAGDELTVAHKSWHMDVEPHPSMTSNEAQILVIKKLRARGSPTQKTFSSRAKKKTKPSKPLKAAAPVNHKSGP